MLIGETPKQMIIIGTPSSHFTSHMQLTLLCVLPTPLYPFVVSYATMFSKDSGFTLLPVINPPLFLLL